MFLLHSVVAFALQFYINSQLLLYCFVGLGLASFSDAGVSLLRVWMAGRVNQSVTVPANEVQITFLMLCCPHLHSCIFFVYFHVLKKNGKRKEKKKKIERKKIRTKASALVSLLKDPVLISPVCGIAQMFTRTEIKRWNEEL